MLILKRMKLPQEPAVSNYLATLQRKMINLFLLCNAARERHTGTLLCLVPGRHEGDQTAPLVAMRAALRHVPGTRMKQELKNSHFVHQLDGAEFVTSWISRLLASGIWNLLVWFKCIEASRQHAAPGISDELVGSSRVFWNDDAGTHGVTAQQVSSESLSRSRK